MNPRERALAILLIGVIILGGGGFFGYQFVYAPWNARTKQLANLKKDANAKVARLEEIKREKPKLALWKSLSLPGDVDVARLEYEKYLNLLLSKHKITTGREITPQKADSNKTAPTTSTKEPIYTRLTYTVHALAPMSNLVSMLKEFYDTGLLQEIKSLTIKRQVTTVTPGGGQTHADELEVNMTVEALIVTGADKRPFLMPNYDRGLLLADLAVSVLRPFASLQGVLVSASPGLHPQGLLATAERNYAAIARKNIFLGRPPREQVVQDETAPVWLAAQLAKLTDITPGTLRTDAVLYDVSTNTKMKLRESSGYNAFPFVRDGRSIRVVAGFVVKIDERELIYRTEFDVPDDARGLGGDAPQLFRVTKADREKLVASGVLSVENAEGLLRVERAYWELLLRQQVIRTRAGDAHSFSVQMQRDAERPAAPGGAFGALAAFGDDGGGGGGGPAPLDVLTGRVMYEDDNSVYVRTEERYTLHIGDTVLDSLKKPLSREKVKELKEVAAK